MRLIDADNLVSICKIMADKTDSPQIWEQLISMIESVPTIEAEPVKQGRWIWDDEGYHCSECMYHAYGNTGEVLSGEWHYCPNCGAKMDAKEGEDA